MAAGDELAVYQAKNLCVREDMRGNPKALSIYRGGGRAMFICRKCRPVITLHRLAWVIVSLSS